LDLCRIWYFCTSKARKLTCLGRTLCANLRPYCRTLQSRTASTMRPRVCVYLLTDADGC
jgi:hypothetical protein